MMLIPAYASVATTPDKHVTTTTFVTMIAATRLPTLQRRRLELWIIMIGSVLAQYRQPSSFGTAQATQRIVRGSQRRGLMLTVSMLIRDCRRLVTAELAM